MAKIGAAAPWLGGGLAIAAVWAAFEYLIHDPRLLLEYVRVLTWPIVTGCVLFWLRAPLREKLRSLLKVNILGNEAEWAEEQTGRLDAALRDNVSELLDATDPSVPKPGDDGHEDELNEIPSAAEQPTAGGEDEAASEEDYEAVERPASQDVELPFPTQPTSSQILLTHDQLLRLLQATGWSPLETKKLEQRNADETQAEHMDRVLEFVEKRYGSIRAQAQRRLHNHAQTQENVEEIIKKSAAWGYDMGVAGAPQAVPDIAWKPDGRWHITTEVPRAPQPTRDAGQSRADRHIKELEDEIKEVVRRQGRQGGLGAFVVEDGWLRELKARLRRLDPGNPWAMDRL